MISKFFSRLRALPLLFAKRQVFTSDFCVIITKTFGLISKHGKSPPSHVYYDKNCFTRCTATPFVSVDTHGPKDIFESKFWIPKLFQNFFAHFKSSLHVFKRANFGISEAIFMQEVSKVALLKTWRLDLKCAKKIWNNFRIQNLLLKMSLNSWVSTEINGVVVQRVKKFLS